MRGLVSVAVGVLLMGATACSDDGDRAATTTVAPGVTTTAPGTTSPPTSGPGGTVGRALGDVELKLTRIAEVSQPVAMAIRTGDDGLYVAEKTGRVRVLRGGRLQADAVLDLRSQVSTGGEQGLLGLAFSPDGKHLYVNFTDNAGDTRVVEYVFTDGKASGAGREVLFVDQPFANHNGGNLVFGPDGRLWIGLGDGGGGNDPQGNAQSLGTLLGKMLRIDPKASITSSYGVPTDNPFVGQAGARTEIWSLGLRNPWRYSFDKATGDLWIGDVGQGAREEIDFAATGSRGGENYGWPLREGTRANKEGTVPAGAVDPVLEYSQDDGACSVTGGYVYRGAAIPDLVGAYLYGDFCEGRVRALRLGADHSVAEQADLDLEVESLSSFGQDAAGELYTLSLNGQIYRIDPA